MWVCREELFSQEQQNLPVPSMTVLHCGIISHNHPAPRQVMSSLAPKPTKDFAKEIQENLWHRRKVRKSDSFSHLFSVSMVSAFDSSHMQRVHQSLLEPGVCPICIMSKLADPLTQRKAAFWGASEEDEPSYRPRRSQTLISLSQIRAAAIPVLCSHSFY